MSHQFPGFCLFLRSGLQVCFILKIDRFSMLFCVSDFLPARSDLCCLVMTSHQKQTSYVFSAEQPSGRSSPAGFRTESRPWSQHLHSTLINTELVFVDQYITQDFWFSHFTQRTLGKTGPTSGLPTPGHATMWNHCSSQPKISGIHPGILAFHHHMETLLFILWPLYSSSTQTHPPPSLTFSAPLYRLLAWRVKLASDLYS